MKSLSLLGLLLAAPSPGRGSPGIPGRRPSRRPWPRSSGSTAATVEAWLGRARYRQEIIDLITRPAEAKPWRAYRPIFLTPQRIRDGSGVPRTATGPCSSGWRATTGCPRSCSSRSSASRPPMARTSAVTGCSTRW
ncbi:MAG: lytic murein transglycosylase [Xanthomonadales bacterium]|nr:lytic murein transglycosylase [Xanthomonadales bacterium]